MSVNRLYRDKSKYKTFLAKDLDEAYKLKFFGNSMTRWELEERLMKHNPTVCIKSNATHRAVWDTSKSDGFICGITHMMTIPQYSILEYNFEKDKKLEYVNMYGETTGSEIVNESEEEYKALARGWEVTLAMVEKQGYRVDRKGL